MKNTKLFNFTSKLSRDEMKRIIGGTEDETIDAAEGGCSSKKCTISSTTGTITAYCYSQANGQGCYCYGKSC